MIRHLGLLLFLSLWTLSTPVPAASVTMAWDCECQGYTHVQVRRCTAATLRDGCLPAGADKLGSELPITQTTATDTTGVAGTPYCYNVVATLEGVQPSQPTNTICTLIEPVVSGGPSNLREVVSPTTRNGPSGKR